MVYVSGTIAKDVNDSDKVIKETLENIIEKEKKIIKDYQNLKNFRENAPIEFLDDLDKLLEERKMFLNYKLQSKEKASNQFPINKSNLFFFLCANS